MPRGRKKKELPPLENNVKETYMVQKSKPLFSLWKSELTLSEFKILDTYLSRINSHNPDQREVVIDKGKLEELLGVKRINFTDLDARLEHLQKTVVNIGVNGKIDRITLFERSQAEQDDYGVWKVTLTCTPSAMKYFFNVEKIGYLRYQIRCITSISSLYSYIMFTYLEFNRFRKTWEVSIDELKDILNCTGETYLEYKRFNDLILKKCHKELTEKTEIDYKYEPVRIGRKVAKIKFTVFSKVPELTVGETYEIDGETVEQLAIDVAVPEEAPKYDDESMEYFASACDYAFDAAEMRLIIDALTVVPRDKEDVGGPDSGRYKHLSRAYHNLQVRERRQDLKPVANRLSYLLGLIEGKKKKEE